MSLNIEIVFDPTLKFSWEASDIKTAIESIAFLHGLPKTCPVCEAPIHFFFRSPKGYSYYGLVCEGAPAHEVNFGQHKEGGSLFYEGDGKWELEYSAREGGQQSSAPAASPGSAVTPSQPQQAAAAQTTSAPAHPAAPAASAKADVTQVNMIKAVGRAKKVADLDGLSNQMLGKAVADLDAEGAGALLDYLKTL